VVTNGASRSFPPQHAQLRRMLGTPVAICNSAIGLGLFPNISDCHGERSRATFCFCCRKTKGGSASRPNSILLLKCNVGYAAWLLRPQALGAPVAMTFLWEFLAAPIRELL
jgi:hypothetical protein